MPNIYIHNQSTSTSHQTSTAPTTPSTSPKKGIFKFIWKYKNMKKNRKMVRQQQQMLQQQLQEQHNLSAIYQDQNHFESTFYDSEKFYPESQSSSPFYLKSNMIFKQFTSSSVPPSPLSLSTDSSIKAQHASKHSSTDFILDQSISASSSTSSLASIYLANFPLEELPQELLLKIASYFNLEMVFKFSMTCNKYYKFLQEISIWRDLVFSRYQFSKGSLLASGAIYSHQWKNYCQLKTIYSKKGAITSFYLRCKGVMPSARYQHSGTVIGNSIYYIGGQETQVRRFNEVYKFDVDRSKFSRVEIEGTSHPPKFARHTAVAIKNNIYVFGGFDGTGVYFDLAVFDTKKHTWETPAVNGKPPRSRTNHSSAAVGTDLYIFGGINRDIRWELQDLDEFYVLDTLTLTWKEVEATGDIPSARCGHRMVSIGKKIYLFGGGSGDNWLNKMNEIYIFDTETKVWRKTPSDPIVQVCTFSCVFALGPLICVFGGQHLIRGKVTKKLYIFDTISETWIKQSFSTTLFPSARDMAAANVVNDRVYIFGGYDGRPMDELNILELSPKLKKLINLYYSPN